MPNEKDIFAEFAEKAQGYLTLAEQTQSSIARFTAEIEKVQQVTPIETIWAGLAALAPFFPQPAPAGAVTDTYTRKIEALIPVMERTTFFYNLYSSLPYVLAAPESGITTVEDALAMLNVPTTLSGSDINVARADIARILEALYKPGLVEAAAGVELPELVAPEPTPPITLAALHTLSTAEIVKSFVADRRPPAVLSDTEWEELLKLEGFSDAEIEDVAWIQAEADRIALEWEEQHNMIEAFKAGIAEMPEYKLSDMLVEIVTMPGLAALEAAGFYFEHVSQPLAGLLYRHFSPDIEADYQRLKKSDWDFAAATEAWQNWEANFFVKYILLEGLVDPLSYVGFGIYARIARPIPYVGRMVGAAERGISRVFELPFDAIKTLVARAPKTLTQRATVSTHLTTQTVRQYVQRETGLPLYQLVGPRMIKFTEAVDKAVIYTLKHPGSDDLVARAGREMLAHAPLDEKGLTAWAERLGTTLTPEDITMGTIEQADNIFEAWFMKRAVTIEEAASKTLQLLFVSNPDAAALKLAKRLLEARAARITTVSKAFAQSDDALKAMRMLSKDKMGVYIDVEQSAAYASRQQTGTTSALLFGIDTRLQVLWRNYLDRFIVRPFAEAYLTFGLYGPMNIMEDYIRSTLGHVFPRRMSTEGFEDLSRGLAVDPELYRAGMSEMYGPLARMGDPADFNNWVLQLATLGQKKWAAKLYNFMVRLPGAYGMDVRRNFLARRYLQLLAERGGPAFKKIIDAGPILKNIRTADKTLIKELENAVYRAKTHGATAPDAITALKDTFTHHNLKKAELQNVLSLFPDVPPAVRQLAFNEYDVGTLFKDLDGFAMRSNEILLTDFAKSPEYAAKQIDDLVRRLTQMEVRNPVEMAQALKEVQILCDTYKALPDQVIAAATIRSKRLPAAQRQAIFDHDLDSLHHFLDAAGADISRVIEKLRATTFAPETLSRANWAEMSWSRQFTPELQTRVTKMVDNLPVDIKFDLKGVSIDGRLKVPSKYDPNNKVLTFRSVKDIDGLNLYHEIAHSHAVKRLAAGDWEFMTRWLQAWGVDIDMVRINRRMEKLIAHGYRREAVAAQAVRLEYAEVWENFAESFGLWSSGKRLPKVQTEYFSEFFPKTQMDLGISKPYTDSTGRLFVIFTTRLVHGAQFREQNMFLRRDIFAATPPKQRTAEFWDDFYTQMNAEYRGFEVIDAELQMRMVQAMESLNVAGGIKPFTRPPIKVIRRPLAPQDIANLIGTRGDDISKALLEVLAVNSKPRFTAYVMGYVRTGDIGFTKEAIETVYDQIVYSLHVKPEAFSYITRSQMQIEGLRKELWALHNSKRFSPDEIRAIHGALDETAEAVNRVLFEPLVEGAPPPTARALKPEYANFDDIRLSAMDEAHKWYYKEFPDYTNANAFDAMMKTIYPFWTYESQRWFWLPRSFARHPGTFMAFERWQDNTDYGYVHIPGTSADINPFRGTVYGTLTTRLTRRDFPEYYDELPIAGGVIEFMDYLSRWGFYPGAHVGIPLSIFGGLEAQMGETMPAIYKTPLNLLIALFPDNESVQFISETIFSDRFRDYMTLMMVNKRGLNGTYIWTKIQENIPLTEEEQAAWTDARREAAIYGIGFEQFGLFRLRSEEQYKIYEESTKVIEEMTGLTPEQQDWLRRHGYKIWDVVGGLSPTNQAILQELESYKWLGSVRPLLPSHQQLELNRIDMFWTDVKNYTEDKYHDKLDLQRDFLAGRIGPTQYLDSMSSIYAAQRVYIDDLHDTDAYSGVPITLEERKEMYARHGVAEPVMHPMRELLNLFFEIELNEMIDPETGERVKDWDTFFAQRDAIANAIPTNLKQEWDDYISRNSTPLEQVRYDVNKQYFKVYNNVWEAVLRQYDELTRKLIEEYLYLERTGQNLARQAELTAMKDTEGKALVSNFRTKVSNARSALRLANPTLDAWLYFWGRTSSFKTAEAQAVYIRIAEELGRSP